MNTTKNSKYTLVLFTIILITSCSYSQKNKIGNEFTSQNGSKIKYAYNLPKNYENGKNYNVLITPGDGTPNDSDDFLFWGKKTESYDWILVETNAVIRPGNMKMVQELLEELKIKLKPIGDKFHIMGFSANSAGTFQVALSLPQYFHSVTGVPGHPRTTDDKDLLKIKDMKVNFIVGEKDTYWLNSARNAYSKLTDQGIEVKLNIVKNGGHVLREIKGDLFMEYLEWVRE